MAYSVLIVDDDKELRSLFRIILERESYTVYEAANGAEALKLLASQMPDVIVLDMLMPLLGGEAVLQRIRQTSEFSHVRIVVLTAYPRFRETALNFAVDQFLVKPIKTSELVQAIATTLSSNASG